MTEFFEKNFVDQLSKTIDSSYAGIIWINDPSLQDWKKQMMALDYLFDGLLIKEIYSSNNFSSLSQMKFFMTQNFGFPLFLICIKLDKENLKKDISSQLKMIISQIDNNKQNKILIMKSNEECLNSLSFEDLKKDYPQLEFSLFS